MEALFQTEVTTKILRCLQYRAAQKFSAGENILTKQPSLDVAACLSTRAVRHPTTPP